MKNRVYGFVALATLLTCAEIQATPISPLSIPYTTITTWGTTTPTQAGANLLTLGYGNIVVKSSPGWGGAIYDYAASGSGNVVNRQSPGTLWQSTVNVFEADGTHFVNPTEAGDSYNRGSELFQFQNTTTAPIDMQYTKSVPFGFLNIPQGNEDYLGGSAPNHGNVAVQFNGMTLGKELTLAFNGDNNVAKYVTKVFSTVTASHVTANLPILYLTGNFRTFSTYNAATGNWKAQVVNTGQSNVPSQDYSTCGGIIAENVARTVGVALYGCKPGIHNGGAFHLAFTNASVNGNSDPLATDTTALMSSIFWSDNQAMPAGESSLTTYIIICTAPSLAGSACVSSMARLYNSGY